MHTSALHPVDASRYFRSIRVCRLVTYEIHPVQVRGTHSLNGSAICCCSEQWTNFQARTDRLCAYKHYYRVRCQLKFLVLQLDARAGAGAESRVLAQWEDLEFQSRTAGKLLF